MKSAILLTLLSIAPCDELFAGDTPPTERKGSLPKGFTELNFHDFFVFPIGDRGLEFTDKLRTLDGMRVRITGYVVEQDKPLRNVFLLTASPKRVHEEHYGLADDLPAATLHVIMRQGQERPEPGKPVSVTGILSVGNREEADGRISTVRLLLDQQNFRPRTKKARVGKGAELLRS